MTFFNNISEGVQLLAKSIIDNPKNWKQTTYHYQCISAPDIAIWTANGFRNIKLNGNDAFNTAEKIYLNNAIKKSIALKVTI